MKKVNSKDVTSLKGLFKAKHPQKQVSIKEMKKAVVDGVISRVLK